jgi:hypothetical protein
MDSTANFILFAGGLFVGMIALLEAGRRLGRARQQRDEEGARAGLGAVEGAIFALMGLLVAFTFSGAASRFDMRRQLIIDEANAIGTAWLRLDVLPAAAQPELRDLFRRYLDTRLAVHQSGPDVASARAELARAAALQGEIWKRAVSACQEVPNPVVAQVIPALNEMLDIASTRTFTAQIHPPVVIYCLLGVLALVCSLLAGYAMAHGRVRSWIHILAFALIMATTVYVILDLEFPRLGFIRIDTADAVLLDLRQSMN